MKIAICDDDALCREQTAALIGEYAQGKDISVSVYERPGSVLDDAALMGGFDIYILDVLMPGTDGIQLGMKLRQMGMNGKILYLTSSREYAIDAFKTKAIGYLVKPIRKEALYPLLDEIIQQAAAVNKKSLIVKTRETVLKLDYDSILYAELVRKTVEYRLIGGKTVESTSIRSTFAEAMVNLLRDRRFVLCGSNKVLNLHYISELDTETVTFKNGASLYIGRRAARELRSVWFDFWFGKEASE